jgi:hypothetical protein
MKRPIRASLAGAAYLDLQNRARRERRGTQELLTLFVVERWLARLSASAHASKFVIKGGMLLAAYDARRPTADLDALARSIADDQQTVVSLVSEIADMALDDGVESAPILQPLVSSASRRSTRAYGSLWTLRSRLQQSSSG